MKENEDKKRAVTIRLSERVIATLESLGRENGLTPSGQASLILTRMIAKRKA